VPLWYIAAPFNAERHENQQFSRPFRCGGATSAGIWYTDRMTTADTPLVSTLPSTVGDALRTLITEGSLAPGSRLNERALCDRLGVSRTPLREAFRVLASEGLIELTPNRGAQVVALSDDDVRDAFELMGALEALGGELACSRITPEETAQVKALTFQMLACRARRDLPSYYRLNREIHDRINAAARNRALSQTYARQNLRIQNLRFRSNFDEDKWARAAQEHEAMVDALEARDGERLARILREHLRAKCEAVLESRA
jgi:DNA-binding GntR family transcriptional regulator